MSGVKILDIHNLLVEMVQKAIDHKLTGDSYSYNDSVGIACEIKEHFQDLKEKNEHLEKELNSYRDTFNELFKEIIDNLQKVANKDYDEGYKEGLYYSIEILKQKLGGIQNEHQVWKN